uniref:Uncharacterized protein n=1 Tax=viral metagenome TaxID=1070528 RepID=A0A6M3L8P8_9ZZZZ
MNEMSNFAQEMTKRSKAQGKTFTQIVYEFAKECFDKDWKKLKGAILMEEARVFALTKTDLRERLSAFMWFIKENGSAPDLPPLYKSAAWFNPNAVLTDSKVASICMLLGIDEKGDIK